MSLGMKLLRAAHNPGNAFFQRIAKEEMAKVSEARKIPFGAPGTAKRIFDIHNTLQAQKAKR